MKKEWGKCFDPDLLDAFLESFPKNLGAEKEIMLRHGPSEFELQLF